MRKSWSVVGLLFVGVACTGSGPAEPAASPVVESAPTGEVAATALAATARLTRIADADQVCMVNDQFMGRDQIPVLFEGRTYYGCCAGCVTRIQTDPAVRTALDPITGQSVDKSTAIMGQDSEGNVLYFESEQSFSRYVTQT